LTEGQSTEGGAPPQEGASVVSPPAPDPERARLLSLVEASDRALKDMHAQNTKLARDVQTMSEKISTLGPPPPTAEEADKEFWKTPTKSLAEMEARMRTQLIEEMRNTINPLLVQHAVSAKEMALSKMQTQYADVWDAIEPTVRQFIANAEASGTEISENVVSVATMAAAGAYYRGMLGTTPPSTPAPAPVTTTVTPPHLRPTPPSAPTEGTKKPVRQLTENERRLARERGMTEEQYIDWLEVPSDSVVKATIGKESAS